MAFRRILANPGMKVLALVLAAAYWVLVSAPRRERTVDRSVEDVALAFSGLSRDLIITTPVRGALSVRLRGKGSVLRSISSQSLEATLDLSTITAGGDVSIPIPPQSINVPQEIEVVSIDPPRISLHLEPRRQKFVPIREFLVGQLPDSYSLGEIRVNPPRALVSGPLSLVRNVGEVATERIILSGQTQTFQRTVGLVSDNPLVVILDPPSATVLVEVVPPAPPAPPEDAAGSTSTSR